VHIHSSTGKDLYGVLCIYIYAYEQYIQMSKYECIDVKYPGDTSVYSENVYIYSENVHIHSSTGKDPYGVLCKYMYIYVYTHT